MGDVGRPAAVPYHGGHPHTAHLRPTCSGGRSSGYCPNTDGGSVSLPSPGRPAVSRVPARPGRSEGRRRGCRRPARCGGRPGARSPPRTAVVEVLVTGTVGDTGRRSATWLGDLWSAQRPERGPQLGGEQRGFLPPGEVAAALGHGEVAECGVGLLHPAARCPPDLAGERGEAERDLDRWHGLPGRQGLRSSALPVRPGGRGAGTGQPVRRDVVQDVVTGEVARGAPVDEGAGDL